MKICFKTKRNIEEISIDQDENILFAGLKAGLTLPHECASGTCGTCQGQLLTEDSLIDNWKDAPVWTPEKIKKATKKWFFYLKK